MPEAPRDDVDREFQKYVERGTANDWSAWADQFTEDARYVEYAMGTVEGRCSRTKFLEQHKIRFPCQVKPGGGTKHPPARRSGPRSQELRSVSR